MSQMDPRARSAQQSDSTKEPQEASRHPLAGFQASVRILNRLRRQAAWTWPAAMLLVMLSHPVLAQAGPALATDVTPGQMQSGSLLLRMKSGYVVATRANANGPLHFVVTAKMIF